MVLDDDAGSKAVMFLDQVVIAPVLENNSNSDPRRQAVAWRILAHVGSSSGLQGGSKGATLALQAALKQLAHDDYGRIHNQLLERVSRVAKQTLDEESSEAQVVGVWCLLEALLSSQSTEINTMVKTLQDTHEGLDFCVHAWKTMLQRASQNTAPWIRGTLRSCLLVVTKLASGLDGASGEDCMRSLQRALEGFIVPPDVIGAGMDALVAVSACSDRANVRKVCSTWIRSLFTCCEEELANFVQDVSQAEEDFSIPPERQQKLVRALFTVGELSMVGFRPDDDERDVRKDDADMLRGMHERPSKRLQELMQTMLSTNLPGSKRVPNPVSVRAHAFTVLGKLCLRDEGLAKASLNIFARELHPSLANPTPAVQSNALLVLGDLCVRYTNMTDRYLPVLASCLQAGASNPETNLITNSNPGAAVVRKHAVLLLSSLLLQDYIKWRGLLFHRFLVACSDEDEGVAQLAESVLSGPLFARNQKLFFNHFVEALFVLNKCTAHPIYVSAATHGDGGSGIAVGFDGIHLNGALGQARRRRMYDFLLSKLSDEEKIGITARLAKEVLGGAVSSEGDLGRVCDVSNKNDFGPQLESAWNVVTDAFYVLTSKAIKVGKLQEEDEMEDPNLPNPSRQVNVATSRLMSKISRKHLIESVLPILCNLKTKLQASCSPLLKDLMIYLLGIFRSYKVEVKEYLANDPILLQEIEYDARQQGASNASSQ
jgi:condensin-2 complex subunit D3